MGKNNQKRQPSPETPVVEEEEEDRSEEEERSDDGDEGAYEGSHEDADEQEGGAEEGTGKDGLADMMSRVLNQQVGVAPILAKRNTSLMKDMQKEKEERSRLKALSSERKQSREKQVRLPDATTADFERQLRKLATKGVVTLFNAITKSKKDTEDLVNEHGDDHPVKGEEKRIDVKQIAKNNFFEVLQKSSTASGSTSRSSLKYGGKEEVEQGNSGSKWSVLGDEPLTTNRRPAFKDWDKDDASDDGGEDESELKLTDQFARKGKGADDSEMSTKKKTGSNKKARKQ